MALVVRRVSYLASIRWWAWVPPCHKSISAYSSIGIQSLERPLEAQSRRSSKKDCFLQSGSGLVLSYKQCRLWQRGLQVAKNLQVSRCLYGLCTSGNRPMSGKLVFRQAVLLIFSSSIFFQKDGEKAKCSNFPTSHSGWSNDWLTIHF